jgi:putative inorganic carbon (HCO3(-)) transporter
MRYLVPLVVALIPLIVTPGLLAYFDITPKIAILLFGVSIGLLYRRENERNVRLLIGIRAGKWFAALLGAAWLAAAIATAFSLHPALSLNGGNWRRFGLITWTALLLFTLLAVGWLAADPKNIRMLLRAACASGALASLYGIFQYFGWDPLLPATAYQAGEGAFTIVRPPGTLGHADYFAAWLVVIVFFGFALRRLEKERWRKLAAGAVSVVAIAAIVLSGTRSALLGLIVGAIAFAMAGRRRIGKSAVAIGLASLAAVALFFVSPAGVKLRARLHWSLEDARGGARPLLWRDSLRMSAHRPIAGFGPESFATEFPQFESLELARAYPDFYHESPHNIFLDALTAEGALGLVALLGMCALAIVAAIDALRSKNEMAAALAASFTGILICQQFTVFIPATALYFFLIVGLLIVCSHSARPTHATAPRWLFPVGVVAALVFVWFAARLLIADVFLATAHRQIQVEGARGAAQAYQRELRWRLSGAGSDLNYSRAMQQLASHSQDLATQLQARQQAMEAGIRATSTAEDRQNAWFNLATLFAAENNVAATERSLHNAIAWSPNWFKPHWSLAQLLEMTNRHSEALREARAAVERNGGHDPEVTETLRKLEQ